MKVANRTFSLISLGCPKNTVDSEVLKGELLKAGWIYLEKPNEAAYVIINTCGFIQPAKEESIETILDTIQLKKSGKVEKVIVWGCLTQRYFDQLRTELPEVDCLFGVDAQSAILEYLTGQMPSCQDFTHSRNLLTPSHYAYLKIAEGCDNACSFCAIPNIRGPQKSRSIDSLLSEAEYLKSQGVIELIVIAQDITRYGFDLKPASGGLFDLLSELLRARLFPWVRLMYANPAFWQSELNSLFNDYPELCPYLDIPIQHASNRLLRRMKRGITRQKMSQVLQRLRREVPNLALRTAVMVGYPSEEERDFEALLDFIEEIRFERLGVFSYSSEEGTPAGLEPDNVPPEIKEERRELLMQVQYDISHEFARQKIGKNITVLIEKRDGDYYLGRTVWDAPEVDCFVRVTSQKSLPIGEFQTVQISGVDGLDLIGFCAH